MALCLSSYSHLSCLCMLLAINLSNLDLWLLKILPDGVQFQPSTISKQSRPSQSVTPFVFPSFPADKGSYPKETLIACMTRTESFRGSQTGNNRKTRLFLSYIWPHNLHNLVTSSSIARWILSTLQSSGMDTTTFKAHSVRDDSASATTSAGITTNQIIEAAYWSSEFDSKDFSISFITAFPLVQQCFPLDQQIHYKNHVIRALQNVITW